MQFNLAVLPGDGVGPEVTGEAIKVLQAVGKRFGHDFSLNYGLIGGVAIDNTGNHHKINERSLFSFLLFPSVLTINHHFIASDFRGWTVISSFN